MFLLQLGVLFAEDVELTLELTAQGRSPRFYSQLKGLPPAIALRDALREVKTLARVVEPLLHKGSDWLSNQSSADLDVSRYTVPGTAGLDDETAFTRWLLGASKPPQGVDSFYVTPANWKSSPISYIADAFPNGCGLKISKNVGDIASPYMTSRSGRSIQRKLAGPHSTQIQTYRYLSELGLGPELFGIVEIIDGRGAIRVGYVVEHIEGSQPAAEEFQELVSQLQSLCVDRKVALVSGSGWSGRDFKLPDGNGNAIKSSKDGKVKYIDVHSFRVLDTDTIDSADGVAET